MTEEIWKPIDGFDGKYIVSNCGGFARVCPNGTVKRKKARESADGYLRINLSKNGKAKEYQAHRIVALTFTEKPVGLDEINHKDKNRKNNNIENLEWCNRTYNIRYSKAKKVLCLLGGVVVKKYNALIDVKKDGFNFGNVGRVCRERKGTVKGYEWRYADE